jgi:predicted GNAT family N-acyltransferase
MSDASEAVTVIVARVKNEAELLQALAIREVVFIEEQHVPEGIERDAEDATAFHLLAFSVGHAIGTGRLVTLDKAPSEFPGKWGQISRMAVLESHRKSGVGSLLLAELEAEARRQRMRGLRMHAQLSALSFYQRHGYTAVGPVFLEAGIDHLEMRKLLEG